MCWPRNNNRRRPDKYVDHPKAVYIREDALLDAVSRFFADRVLGPHRRDVLAADLEGLDDRATHERHAERERRQRVVADVARRQNSVLRQAQDGDPDDPFTKALRGTYNDLEAEKTAALAAIAQLDETKPDRPSATDMDLLDTLPYLALNLVHAPEPLLRTLFELTQLAVRLHEDSGQVTITIKLPADQLPDIVHAAERITDTMPSTQETPAQPADACVDAVRVPAAARAAFTLGGSPGGGVGDLVFRLCMPLDMERRAQGGQRRAVHAGWCPG
jgi:site-specific DNA recombinase